MTTTVGAAKAATSLPEAAQACLAAASPEAKVSTTRAAADAFRRGELAIPADAPPPEPIRMPGRPPRPRLVHPRDVPRRGFGSNEGRAAFIHAVAHIEFNAIDLAWDAVYRFRGMPEAYYADWVGVADDEARHFTLLQARQMAEKTADDVLARMALVPRVLEARGLDVTPGMIVKLREAGDESTARILELILREEVAHVAAGSRWFRWCCEQRGVEPRTTFGALLREHASGVLHGPLNLEARLQAGFSAAELDALRVETD